jgi:hypothetical protein
MRIVPLIFFLLISTAGFGQKKSFLVTDTGDSIYGTIKLRYKSFIVNTPAGTQQIAADHVRRVYASNFKGSTVVHCMLHLYTDNLAELEMGSTPLKERDTVLILQEVYTSDKMNLYFGTDDIKTQYYFYKMPSDPVPVQLVVRYRLGGGLSAYYANPAEYRGDKSRVHIEEDKGYVNQLKAAMADCDAIPETTWDLLDYRVYSLKNLIKKYNECN